jgi:hypothetical protein
MYSLFIVCTKLIGIYFVFLTLTNLLNMFPFLIYSFKGSEEEMVELYILFSNAFSMTVQLVLALPLLFRTGWIADKLRIKDDIAESLPLSLNSILRAGIILIGVFIFTTRISSFARTVYYRVLADNSEEAFAATYPQSLSFSTDMITPGITIAFSLLLIFGSKIIVRIIGH